MLDPGRGRTKTGQLWAYARDDRPWGGADPPAVAYVYAPDRKAERPLEHLAGFTGTLQVGGYGGYAALARGEVTLAFCWAHVRRRFYELAKAGASPMATDLLARIATLYAVETDLRGRSPERITKRQERSRPIVDDLHAQLQAGAGEPQKRARRSDPLRAHPLGRADPLPRGRPGRAGQ